MALQPIVKVFPHTWVANALRAVIIDDASLWAARWDLVVPVAVGGVFVVVARRCFRRE